MEKNSVKNKKFVFFIQLIQITMMYLVYLHLISILSLQCFVEVYKQIDPHLYNMLERLIPTYYDDKNLRLMGISDLSNASSKE